MMNDSIEGIMTVGDLMNSLKDLNPSMNLCITIEGHSFPLGIANLGIMKLDKKNNLGAFDVFFLDVARKDFMKFIEMEIIEPTMQLIALEKDMPEATLQ